MASAFDEAVVINPAHKRTPELISSPHSGPATIDDLSKKLKWLDTQTHALKKKLDVAKGNKSFSHLLEQEESMNKICQEIKHGLDRLSFNEHDLEDPINRTQNHKKTKLEREFMVVLEQFTTVSFELAELSMTSAHEFRDSFHHPTSTSEDVGVEGGSAIHMRSLENISDVDEMLVEERIREAESIAKKTQEINALFMDVSRLVTVQGEQVNVIADQIDRSAANTSAGVDHIRAAERHQRAHGKTLGYMGCFMLTVGVIAVIIVFFFAGTVGLKKK